MNKNSLFTKAVLIILLTLCCFGLTVALALLFGSVETNLLDFRNLNFANVFPVLIIGGGLSCVVIGIAILYFARSAFFKAKDYFKENENKGEHQK
ncbi:MAG: hypothetical protein E7580_08970 [Ruminococcaceae bacterium]|nr:hypothetical protein [Oscillospiraceae bacterium]